MGFLGQELSNSFLYPLAICVSSLEKCLLQSLDGSLIGELHIQTTGSSHLIPVRMVILIKPPRFGKEVGAWKPCTPSVGMQDGTAAKGNHVELPQTMTKRTTV